MNILNTIMISWMNAWEKETRPYSCSHSSFYWSLCETRSAEAQFFQRALYSGLLRQISVTPRVLCLGLAMQCWLEVPKKPYTNIFTISGRDADSIYAVVAFVKERHGLENTWIGGSRLSMVWLYGTTDELKRITWHPISNYPCLDNFLNHITAEELHL